MNGRLKMKAVYYGGLVVKDNALFWGLCFGASSLGLMTSEELEKVQAKRAEEEEKEYQAFFEVHSPIDLRLLTRSGSRRADSADPRTTAHCFA